MLSENKYPSMEGSKVIAVDIETYDPMLIKLGPGVYRSLPRDFKNKNGYILGVSLANDKGVSNYYNLGHYDCSNKERKENIAYLERILSLDIPKLGTNIVYDINWLENWCLIPVKGQLYDIQVAEALIDENQDSYSLDNLAWKYLGESKQTGELMLFCRDRNLKGDVRKHLYQMPFDIVREYALGDVQEPVEIFRKQWVLMHEQELLGLFHMECDLLRCNLLMYKTGVKLDIEKRDINRGEAYKIREKLQFKLFKEYGNFNHNSSQAIANILTKEGIDVPSTNKGRPSVTKNFLKSVQDESDLAKDLLDLRQADKIESTFLNGSYVDFVTDDSLIHCTFYNTRTDANGTRSGRLSCAKPNLQQIPSKSTDKFWGRICREPFVPFDNCWWARLDYSQIEYRFIAHYAKGDGAATLVEAYKTNPQTDYHQYIMDLTGLERSDAKRLNFGVAYGMGAKGMSTYFGWELDYARALLDTYHRKAPYMKMTIHDVESKAIAKGYITTILRRRARLLEKKDAYKMFNRKIQGSAADLMKQAMLNIYTSNLLKTLHMHLTIHDELDVSVPKTKDGLLALGRLKLYMESAIPLKVPVKVDVELGHNWANCVPFDVEDTHINGLKDSEVNKFVNDKLNITEEFKEELIQDRFKWKGVDLPSDKRLAANRPLPQMELEEPELF